MSVHVLYWCTGLPLLWTGLLLSRRYVDAWLGFDGSPTLRHKFYPPRPHSPSKWKPNTGPQTLKLYLTDLFTQKSPLLEDSKVLTLTLYSVGGPFFRPLRYNPRVPDPSKRGSVSRGVWLGNDYRRPRSTRGRNGSDGGLTVLLDLPPRPVVSKSPLRPGVSSSTINTLSFRWVTEPTTKVFQETSTVVHPWCKALVDIS